MKRRKSVPSALADLASAQCGVVSRAQCRALKLGRAVLVRLLRDQWRAVAPGIYLTHRGELPWLGAAWVGILLGGTAAVIGGDAAGHLHGLVKDEPSDFTVFIPHRVRRTDQDRWNFVRSTRPSRGEPPRTKLEDTVLDMCATRSERDVMSLLADVLATRRTTQKRLLEALAHRKHYPHKALFRAVLAEVHDGVHSVLERDYHRDVEEAHGLPVGRRQARLAGNTDVYYDEYEVVVELDGQLGHTGSGKFRDMDRDNRNALRARGTLRYGFQDVRVIPCEVADQVGEMLASHGWAGVVTACPKCTRARYR